MSLAVRLAVRNLLRRPLRTTLTALMIVIGNVLAIWLMGTVQGSYDTMIDGTTRGWIGHFQMLDRDYHDRPSLYRAVQSPEALVEALAAVPGVLGVTTRIESGGLLAAENRTVAVALVGIDPEREASTSTLKDNVEVGQWLSSASMPKNENLPMIVGRGVASRLKVEVGSEVSFVGQAADGSIAAELFTVSAIYDSGSRAADRAIAFARLKDLQDLLVLGDRVHRIVGTVAHTGELPSVMARLPRSDSYWLADWAELNPQLAAMIEADRQSGTVMLWVVIIVVVLGVANTMAMSVFERTRELGVMLALGTSPRQVVGIVLWEVGILSIFAVTIGIGLGALANAWTAIPLPEPLDIGGVVITHITASNTWTWTVLNPLWVVVASLLSALVSARRAARLDPVRAIRGIAG